MQAIDDLTSSPQLRVVRERLDWVLQGSKVVCARFHVTSGTQVHLRNNMRLSGSAKLSAQSVDQLINGQAFQVVVQMAEEAFLSF